jgi:hypothetical protein
VSRAVQQTRPISFVQTYNAIRWWARSNEASAPQLHCRAGALSAVVRIDNVKCFAAARILGPLGAFSVIIPKEKEKGKYAVRPKPFLLLVAAFILFLFSSISTRSQTVVTFDNISETGTGSFIPDGYQGLVWSNFVGMNAILYAGSYPFYTNGYYYGIVSPSNVAYDADASPAKIESQGTNFDFLSTYLTAAWNTNLNIEVQGFRGGTLLYATTVVPNVTSSTLFTFNYLNIDRLDFTPSGGIGEPANGQFAMDNFTFEFVPEPSSLLLAALGGVSLITLLKRRRA